MLAIEDLGRFAAIIVNNRLRGRKSGAVALIGQLIEIIIIAEIGDGFAGCAILVEGF